MDAIVLDNTPIVLDNTPIRPHEDEARRARLRIMFEELLERLKEDA